MLLICKNIKKSYIGGLMFLAIFALSAKIAKNKLPPNINVLQ